MKPYILWVLMPCLFITISILNLAADDDPLDYSAYKQLLAKYVDEKGLVNYKDLKADDLLPQALVVMKNVNDQDYVQWEEQEQIAFWCNAYNLFTLKAIADHYPIKAGWLSSLTYPKNSIRQISGVWDKLTFEAMGERYTLNQIEHEILRVEFNEPRIHFAIVCASIGCPPLRNEAFTGADLERQLDEQSKRFLSHPQNFRIDKEQNKVYLSSILSWFGEDFTRSYSIDERFAHLNSAEQAVIHFICQYVDENTKQYLESNEFSIAFNSYDWTLNEQSPTK